MWRSEEKMQPRNPKTEPSWRIHRVPGGSNLVSSAAPPRFLNETRASRMMNVIRSTATAVTGGPIPEQTDCIRERQPATATSVVLLLFIPKWEPAQPAADSQ